MKNYSNQKGSALVIVLVITVVIITVATFSIKLAKGTVNDIKAIKDKLEAKINAVSLFEITKYTICVSPFYENYVLNISGKDIFPEKIYLTGTTIKTKYGNVSLTDASSKINAFYLTREQIRSLFSKINPKNVKTSDIAYDSYEDWKDKDKLKRINGAEDYYYKFEKGYKYGARNSQVLQDKEELRNIKGFTENYQSIEKYLSFFYKGSLLNINTANADILSIAFNIPYDIAKQLVLLRKRKGLLTFSDITRLSGKDISIFVDYYSTFPSKVVEIHIATEKGESKEIINAVVDFNTTQEYPFTVIKYQE